MASKKNKEVIRTGWKEGFGIVFLAMCVLALLSYVSYDPLDVGVIQQPPNRPPENFIGPFGAWFAFLTFMLCGVSAYVLPVFFGVLGMILVFKREGRVWPRLVWALVLLLTLVWMTELTAGAWEQLAAKLNVGNPGGILGAWTAQALLIRFLGNVGTWIIAIVLFVAGLFFLLDIEPVEMAHRIRTTAGQVFERANTAIQDVRDRQRELEKEGRDLEKRRRRLEKTVRRFGKSAGGTAPAPMARTVDDIEASEPEPLTHDRVPDDQRPAAESERPHPVAMGEDAPPARPERNVRKPAAPIDDRPLVSPARTSDTVFELPGLDMLHARSDEPARNAAGPDLDASASVLEETLRDFGIDCQVTNVERGPVVTRYEVLPAAGVRVEKIGSLSNNIALALKALSVRVQAPIPGKGVVGIEVPNAKTTVVRLRELMECAEWKRRDLALPLALGKDVAGREMIADLADMPHLLIAGATGSGKTVCMNSLLAGLLMTRTPDEMRLMLIDPKIVEFTPFDGLPHLVVPVITDAKKVSLGLRWAINEMEKRYKMFAKAGVRNIRGFNSRPIIEQTDLFAEEDAETPAPGVPDRLPYIVIVVDELADLMLIAQAEIENHIARLAQLSRAVGIHMILATQRPSVNVITGTIKANFPARIAFQVAQKVDSRTILDTVGADKLLGKGDLLFLPPGSSKLIRAQGCLTEDQEIRDIVDFIRNQTAPDYEADIHEKMESKAVDLPSLDDHEDELMDSAIEVIRQTRRASTSSLQRRLRIGYTRAARLMDMLEEKGVVGPPQGSDPREILIDLDGEIAENTQVE